MKLDYYTGHILDDQCWSQREGYWEGYSFRTGALRMQHREKARGQCEIFSVTWHTSSTIGWDDSRFSYAPPIQRRCPPSEVSLLAENYGPPSGRSYRVSKVSSIKEYCVSIDFYLPRFLFFKLVGWSILFIIKRLVIIEWRQGLKERLLYLEKYSENILIWLRNIARHFQFAQFTDSSCFWFDTMRFWVWFFASFFP